MGRLAEFCRDEAGILGGHGFFDLGCHLNFEKTTRLGMYLRRTNSTRDMVHGMLLPREEIEDGAIKKT